MLFCRVAAGKFIYLTVFLAITNLLRALRKQIFGFSSQIENKCDWYKKQNIFAVFLHDPQKSTQKL